jgi:ferredoxin-NADP reductase
MGARYGYESARGHHRRADEAGAVKSLGLCAVDGRKMPAWTPSAHIDVVLPSGLTRQYSLCSDPDNLSNYRIAVLRQDDGHGGIDRATSDRVTGCQLVDSQTAEPLPAHRGRIVSLSCRRHRGDANLLNCSRCPMPRRVYRCGPVPLITAVQDIEMDRSRLDAVQVERFAGSSMASASEMRAACRRRSKSEHFRRGGF